MKHAELTRDEMNGTFMHTLLVSSFVIISVFGTARAWIYSHYVGMGATAACSLISAAWVILFVLHPWMNSTLTMKDVKSIFLVVFGTMMSLSTVMVLFMADAICRDYFGFRLLMIAPMN